MTAFARGEVKEFFAFQPDTAKEETKEEDKKKSK
jgi:hypothetical protein